ncbi:putative bifunctional diguanylate cyclase/phosphodiesterase [Agrobacterium vitis]|uniref:putative bifunctional diguanylate cyclase/phosphodiesterase n=1 Tax=Agrobacterium vitis TaxID=373 RepID=UPI001F1A5206|nr:EAL domain-containing protein [Agrobacterium vitis]
MASIFRNKPIKDAAVLLSVGAMIWAIAIRFNFHEHLDAFLHRNEAWQLDELFNVISITGLLSLIFAARRIGELKAEIRLRNTAEDNMDWLAHHDPLTGLPNRRALSDRQAEMEALQDGRHWVIYSIDLDGFKKVNDLVGHQGGDLLLREVAQRLTHALPNADVYRMGGDEFLLVSPRSANMDYRHAGQHIVRLLCTPYDVGGMTSEIGASVGFALFPEDSDDFKDATHCADVAMYVAKKAGQNSVYGFERIMEDRVMRRAETEMALKRAIRDNLIVPYYQPLIDLKSGELRGFEALARWKTGPNHYVPPSDFIELAETAGLIVELSDSLFRQACLDALKWPDTVRLAFNISPTQFIDRQLSLRIMSILMETGFPPSRLEIEITETALVHDIELATQILADLRQSGIRIALDDFGTGYSSLSQLSKFTFDKIKIDRSFVMSYDVDKKQEDIMRAILGLGQGLGIATTAEGIEDENQLAFLKSIGCDFGQGFLFSKALPAEQALSLTTKDASIKPDAATVAR